jgi:Flp pilus assembly protein TadG
MRRLKLRDENGAALVEFALTVPILFGFVFGLMQVCLLYYTYEWVSECSREATRYAVVRGSTCETSAGDSCTASATAVNAYINGIGLPNLAGGTVTANTTYPDGDEVPGHRVKVVVTYAFPYKIPFVASKSLSFSSTSEMYILQ